MSESKRERQEFTFEIHERICVLGKGRDNGFTKEFNLVSFRDMPPKWDIREWNFDHTRMTKGMTLTNGEMRTILEAMKDRENQLLESDANNDTDFDEEAVTE